MQRQRVTYELCLPLSFICYSSRTREFLTSHVYFKLFLRTSFGILINVQLPVAEWLISEEIVPPTAASSTGATALHVAAENGQEQIVQYAYNTNFIVHPRALNLCCRFLLAAGVPLDIKSKLGLTPLHMAAEKGQLNCVRQLRTLGADHLHRNSDGMTPMHRAAHGGHTEVPHG